jgi:hypothetical protein
MDPNNPDAHIFDDFFLFFEQSNLSQPPSLERSFNFSPEVRELPIKRNSAFKSSGHPLNLFLYPPAEEFICRMCEKVVKKPLECKKCGSLFCTPCVSEVNPFNASSKLNCSVCKTATNAKIPSHLLLRIISEQKIRCKNEDLGCESIFNLGDIQKHDIICPYRQVICQNYEVCKNKGFLKDFKESTTPSRIYSRPRGPSVKVFTCSQECFKIFAFKEMVEGKQISEALKEYYEILNKKTSD